jgi:hypothetical protein
MPSRIIVVFWPVLALTGVVAAQEQDTPPPLDAGPYNLFNPMPREAWREMSPERPDKTENATTVNAGVVQLEIGFAAYEYDSHRTTPDKVESFSIGHEAKIRLGLLDDTELQVMASLYTWEKTTPDVGPSTTERGFSDVQLRLRHNFWGNKREMTGEYGNTALGLDGFVVLPTGTPLSTDKVGGGAAVNLIWRVAEVASFRFTLEPSAAYDNGRGSYDFELLHTAAFFLDTFPRFGLSGEYIGTATSHGSSEYEAELGLGSLYLLTDDIVLDVGIIFGLNRAAPDASVTAGITVRF